MKPICTRRRELGPPQVSASFDRSACPAQEFAGDSWFLPAGFASVELRESAPQATTKGSRLRTVPAVPDPLGAPRAEKLHRAPCRSFAVTRTTLQERVESPRIWLCSSGAGRLQSIRVSAFSIFVRIGGSQSWGCGGPASGPCSNCRSAHHELRTDRREARAEVARRLVRADRDRAPQDRPDPYRGLRPSASPSAAVSVSPAMMARSIGAAPRHGGGRKRADSGSRVGAPPGSPSAGSGHRPRRPRRPRRGSRRASPLREFSACAA